MTALAWDQPGERIYQTGISRGVLYLLDGTAVVWNGLTGVEESPNVELKSYYLDGVKYLEYLSPGDFAGTLKAFTYPDEFDSVNGILDVSPGFRIHDQPPKSFGLSYQTRIGNDLNGVDNAYLIHLLYNLVADPSAYEFATLGSDQTQAIEFNWGLTATPVRNSDFNWRPTAHVSIDSRDVSSDILAGFEEVLYGTESEDPRLPTIDELSTLLTSEG